MKDTFDDGRRDRRYNEVVVQDDDEETTDQSYSQHDQTDPENEESAQEEEVKSGSKRHQRTQSLENATEVPKPKRHSSSKKYQLQLKTLRLHTL